ncbi:hypothetical protein vseg_017434 [Gypsophila vaccaria]
MEQQKEPLPADELRCHRNDGRSWRCKNPAVAGKSHCLAHLYRSPLTPKPPKIYHSTPLDTDADTGPATRFRARARNSARVKPEPVDEGDAEIGGEKGDEDNVVADVEERENGEGDDVEGVRGTRLKSGSISADVEERENSEGDDVEGGRGSVGADVEEEMGADVERVRGPRVKRANLGSEVEERENNKVKVKVKVKGRVKGKVKAKEKAGAGEEGEEWRCKRTDGREWRCKRRVSEGKAMCELHYEQARLRQRRVAVPEGMKLQRKRGRGEEGDDDDDDEEEKDVGMKRMKAELIRVFLRREIIQMTKRSGSVNGVGSNAGEITRDLPYGFMAISPPPSIRILDNVASFGVRVGVGVPHCSDSLVRRRFRSKNIEPLPVGPLKAVPFAENVRKVKNGGKRKCHWCWNSDVSSLTKCLSCRVRVFCASCIKERDVNPAEVEVKCPVCRGNCDCKACCSTQTKNVSSQENLKGGCKGSTFQQLLYVIKLLLPILEQINKKQTAEIETEARFKGQNLSEIDIRQSDIGCRDQCYCNNCKSPILDIHRSCPNCSYTLCLSCCQEYSQSGCLKGTVHNYSQPRNVTKTHLPGLRLCSERIVKSNSAYDTGSADRAAADSLSDSTPCLHVSCPPMELGGCDNSLLDLRCIFPLNWTKELEIRAKEAVSGHELPETTDDSLHCSLCARATQAAHKNKEIQEASRRAQSHDNFVYCPSSSDEDYNVLAHFQKHWRKGHPVKFRNVIQCASALSLDPVAIFCSCLENNPSSYLQGKHDGEVVNCEDWYEAEIGTRESFARSLEGYTHRRHKTLRVKAKLSSTSTQSLLDDRYSEIINALPLQLYTNPTSGLLNIAGKLPEDFSESKLGPHVYISFGSQVAVARGELVTKLNYNSCDVVNILTHVADATCSAEQLNQISLLIKQKKAEQTSYDRENNVSKMHNEVSGEVEWQNDCMEGFPLVNGVIAASCCSPVTNDIPAINPQDNKSPAKRQSSDTDSDASVICSATSDNLCDSIDELSQHERLESSRLCDKSEPCGAQWDVYRRQDVPKLLEYIMKHVEELSYSNGYLKNVVHPILDGSFYLDSTHKMRLKEEFDIEPWTFNQCLGEAVFIPAGCPYQIKNVKSCINIALGFISPENASECIKLINEIRNLPSNHKAKQVKLEVEKMALCSIDKAIKEIYRLRSEENKPSQQDHSNSGTK